MLFDCRHENVVSYFSFSAVQYINTDCRNQLLVVLPGSECTERCSVSKAVGGYDRHYHSENLPTVMSSRRVWDKVLYRLFAYVAAVSS